MVKHRSDQPTPRDQRREQFVKEQPARSEIWPVWNVLIFAVAVVLIAVVAYATRPEPATGAAYASTADRGGDMSFPLSEFADGQARFYRYVNGAGKEIRFFILRSSDGQTRAAFDTCDVCYRERRGYRQSGDTMICNNCSQSFPSHSINDMRGGCNPAPIERVIQGDRLILKAAALEQGAFYF